MTLRVLVGCEYSGVVRQAFRDLGHDAWSCDLLPAEDNSEFHIQGDVFDVIDSRTFDVGIFHPPCTYLCNSGARWLYTKEGRWQQMVEGAEFFKALWNCNIPHIAVENPIMHKHARKIIGAKQTMTLQPWQHGHGESKRTCLWLKGLPKLLPSNVVAGREQKVWKMAPSPTRWKDRSRTYGGVGKAMANQWSLYLCDNEEYKRKYG